MGVVGNYPLALAAGLGINAIVAFSLTGRGLTPQGAMGVIVLEGLVVTLLVVVGLREAVMNAVPLALKRAIGVGIGLFILFIGFVDGGFIATPQGGTPDRGARSSRPRPASSCSWLGLLLTMVLFVRKVPGALIIRILVTTVVALLAGVAAAADDVHRDAELRDARPVRPDQRLHGPRAAGGGPDDLRDHADRLLRHDGHGHRRRVQAGLAEEDGSVPGVGRVLLVDSVAAVAGGAAGVSSNTTYIESAAGVAEGGRTGFASVVTGVLFLFAIFLSPLATIIPTPGDRRRPWSSSAT